MKNTDAQALNTLGVGRKGIVVAVRGESELRERLIGMGLHVGDEIRVLHQGEEATPILIVAGETRLALGQEMAKQILLIPLKEEKPSCKPLKARLRRYLKKIQHGGNHEKTFGRFGRGRHGKDCRIRERKFGVS
jgi:Fe2+ transport system protein FeoA